MMATAAIYANQVLEAALSYAERGIPVFPCRADNKRPHLEHGFKEASTDLEQIREWWRRWPDAMVACPTGTAIGAWVLDVDSPAEFEAAVCALGLALPSTRRASTGKGYHLYFKSDPAHPVRNAQRTPKGWPFPTLPGAETRGDGGYIILPPSLHPAGRTYEWQRDETACEAPDELLRIVTATKAQRGEVAPVEPAQAGKDTRYGLAALDDECQSVLDAPAGAQEMALNSAGLKIGALVAGGSLSLQTAKARLVGAGLAMPSYNSRDPWTPELIVTKVDRALSDGAASPKTPPLRVVKSRSSREPASSAASEQVGSDGRTVIQVREGALHVTATRAEKALLDAGAPFYVRNGIVRPIVDVVPTFRNRTTKVARLKAVDGDTMVDHLSRAAAFTRLKGKAGEIATDPPRPVAMTILSRDGEWSFPRLAGVITTPTMRPDGTILADAGYDPTTQLLLLQPPKLPPMPSAPTKADADAALKKLDQLLDEFPFVDPASRSVALSGLISPVLRAAMLTVPLVVTTAPVAGSGKSYIIDLAGAMAIGNRAPVLSAGKTDEETEKRLAGALLKGQPIISIDNVNGQLGGDLLCQAVERPLVDIRPLGGSDIITVDNRACLYATGNNIHVVGDMTRRVIIASLDPNVERPEMRSFRVKPFDMIAADRGGYIAAALTIGRAYAIAGYPDELPALASFEDWSRLVRSALVWLGKADPLDTMMKARDEDPVLKSLKALFNSWYQAADTRAYTLAGIKDLAELRDPLGNTIHKELQAALGEMIEDRFDNLNPRKLGRVLGRHNGRIVDGLKLISAEDSHAKQKVWRVVKV